MAKANEVYSSGQFLTASLSHFTVAKATMVAADTKHLVETTSTRATVVILGAISGTGASTATRVAVENNGSWTAATLQAALGAGWTITAMTY